MDRGVFDYAEMTGDTGPLVYPAARVWIFGALRAVTQGVVRLSTRPTLQQNQSNRRSSMLQGVLSTLKSCFLFLSPLMVPMFPVWRTHSLCDDATATSGDTGPVDRGGRREPEVSCPTPVSATDQGRQSMQMKMFTRENVAPEERLAHPCTVACKFVGGMWVAWFLQVVHQSKKAKTR